MAGRFATPADLILHGSATPTAALLPSIVVLPGLLSAMTVFAALAASLLRKLLVLRKAALLVRHALASLTASFLRKLPILREATLFVWHALAAFTGDLALLVFVHGSEAALGRAISVLCHFHLLWIAWPL
jgi:hypothetical protein